MANGREYFTFHPVTISRFYAIAYFSETIVTMAKRRTVYDAFNEEFEKNLSCSQTYQQAYQRTDASFEEKIGASVYSNYESFRTLRSKRRGR